MADTQESGGSVGRSLPPIGINLAAIRVTPAWWLDAARRADAAGFAGVWCWDHFLSRGKNLSSTVLECWTTLTAAAAVTERLRVGSFVINVMNRHPAVLARMAATLHEFSAGRLELGIGIGGYPEEHEMLGIDFPDAPGRIEHLEEAVAILRLLFAGGAAEFQGRHYRLSVPDGFPVRQPAPRIIVGGESRPGARLAARIGDAWTTGVPVFEEHRGLYEETLAAEGRKRADAPILLTLDLEKDRPLESQPLVADLAGEAARWRERGADELIVHDVRPDQFEALLTAAERAGLPDA
jgi:alkanesulfonate monooxygenase SsuD/methylene tetrahydromethanopterin reductase-like flavin-dependent oxidoreductase (luciferase family)